MKIRCTFVWPGSFEGPELAMAWDEYSVDENDKGWREARDKAIETYGDELRPEMVRDVDFEVDYDALTKLFTPAELEAGPITEVT